MNGINKKQLSLIKIRAYAFSFFTINATAVFIAEGDMPDAFWTLFLIGFLFFSGIVLKYGIKWWIR